MNTVIACGGTGGHLFPGLAVAEVLRARGHEVMLFVSEKEIDALALSGRADFRFQKLPTVGLPSPFSPAVLGFRAPLQRKSFALPRHLSKIQTARRPRDGRLHLDRAGARRKDARHSDFHSRIQRDSRQGEPADRAHGARCSAGLQGMRAVFSQSPHGSHRHADPQRAAAARSKNCAATAGFAGGFAHAFGHGRKPGRQWHQSGHDQIASGAARRAPSGHPSCRRAR